MQRERFAQGRWSKETRPKNSPKEVPQASAEAAKASIHQRLCLGPRRSDERAGRRRGSRGAGVSGLSCALGWQLEGGIPGQIRGGGEFGRGRASVQGTGYAGPSLFLADHSSARYYYPGSKWRAASAWPHKGGTPFRLWWLRWITCCPASGLKLSKSCLSLGLCNYVDRPYWRF